MCRMPGKAYIVRCSSKSSQTCKTYLWTWKYAICKYNDVHRPRKAEPYNRKWETKSSPHTRRLEKYQKFVSNYFDDCPSKLYPTVYQLRFLAIHSSSVVLFQRTPWSPFMLSGTHATISIELLLVSWAFQWFFSDKYVFYVLLFPNFEVHAFNKSVTLVPRHKGR